MAASAAGSDVELNGDWPANPMPAGIRQMVLRAPCPLCGEVVETLVDDTVNVGMKPLSSADGWHGWTFRITASASTVHYHREG
jgi:hypothetical protein